MTRDVQTILGIVAAVWLIGTCAWAVWVIATHRGRGAWKPGRIKSWSVPSDRPHHGARSWSDADNRWS